MKRALSLLMAASLALGLAACGNNASTNDDANAAGDNNGASGSDKVWVIASDTVFKPLNIPMQRQLRRHRCRPR